METRLLKLFSAVAETGSVAAAAAKLFLTPSAISHGLKALEAELGCRLFERTSRKMLLTPLGEEFLANIQPPLAALDAAAAAVRQNGSAARPRLRVGMAASICQYVAPPVIRELRRKLGELDLHLITGDSPELMEMVRAHKLDLGLGVRPPTAPGLKVRPAFTDELMLVFAPNHPWAAGKPISAGDLQAQPIILYQRASFTVRLVMDFFKHQDINPRSIMEIGSIAAIKELVKLNLGISILAPWAAHHELLKGTLRMRPISRTALRREWVLFGASGRKLSPAGESFCRLCRAQAQALRLDRKDVPRRT